MIETLERLVSHFEEREAHYRELAGHAGPGEGSHALAGISTGFNMAAKAAREAINEGKAEMADWLEGFR